jgi:hypothetical protein
MLSMFFVRIFQRCGAVLARPARVFSGGWATRRSNRIAFIREHKE